MLSAMREIMCAVFLLFSSTCVFAATGDSIIPIRLTNIFYYNETSLLWLACTGLTIYIAREKGRNILVWTVLGIIAGPLALTILLCFASTDNIINSKQLNISDSSFIFKKMKYKVSVGTGVVLGKEKESYNEVYTDGNSVTGYEYNIERNTNETFWFRDDNDNTEYTFGAHNKAVQIRPGQMVTVIYAKNVNTDISKSVAVINHSARKTNFLIDGEDTPYMLNKFLGFEYGFIESLLHLLLFYCFIFMVTSESSVRHIGLTGSAILSVILLLFFYHVFLEKLTRLFLRAKLIDEVSEFHRYIQHYIDKIPYKNEN